MTTSSRGIPIQTPQGELQVWTKRLGRNPQCKLLLLHGGPGLSHAYLEPLASALAREGIEVYLYDQLGSGRSERPAHRGLWETARFVDEIEQVRVELGLGSESFVLFGHSWGGLLGLEYSLRHPEALKGLILSNMMASATAFNEYFEARLLPRLVADSRTSGAVAGEEDKEARARLLLLYNKRHVLRGQAEAWPEPLRRAFRDLNQDVLSTLLGDDDFRIAGKLALWNRFEDLPRIRIPTLVIGAAHDTMDPVHMERMANRLANGRYLHCANGSHFAMYDDTQTYQRGVLEFLRDLMDSGAADSHSRDRHLFPEEGK